MPTVQQMQVVDVHRADSAPIQENAPSDKSGHKVRSINALTGLRFLPLFAIVFHHSHSYFKCWRGFAEDISYVHGVSFFFILSGFILTYRYKWVKDAGSSLYFYNARIARLWPAHVMCLCFLIALVPEVFKVRGDLIPVFFCNLFMLHSWIPVWKWYFSFNAPSWSSATLSFFDLCFPFLIWGVRKSPPMVLAVTGSFVLIMIGLCNLLHLPYNDALNPSIPGMIYINPISRVFEFAVGMVCAVVFQRYADRVKLNAAVATSLEVALIGVILYISMHCNSWQSTWVPWATEAGALWIHNSGVIFLPFAILITLLATERGLMARFFGLSFMAVLGDMSFALYMLHGVFISFFAVNFYQEPSFIASLLFFASLLIAAHLMQTAIAKPLQRLMLKLGGKVLALKWTSPRPPQVSKPKSATTLRNQRLFLGAEILVFISVLYAALPTIHPVSEDEAKRVEVGASTRNVYFEPWFKCRSARAQLVGSNVELKTVWQAMQPQNVDFYISAQVLDQKGTLLGQADYCQDGRHQAVKSGAMWADQLEIPVNSASKPATVSIRVQHAKRKWLFPRQEPGSPAQAAMLIAVTRVFD